MHLWGQFHNLVAATGHALLQATARRVLRGNGTVGHNLTEVYRTALANSVGMLHIVASV